MYWRVIPDIVAITVHTSQAPSDEDWDEYLADMAKHVHTIKGLLVYSESVGPSAPQRGRSNDLFNELGADIPTAIMTGSKMVRGIVTAISWAVGTKIKAFSTRDFAGAMKYLELTNEEQLRVRVVLKGLSRGAEVVVDAFADESGKFRRKYN